MRGGVEEKLKEEPSAEPEATARKRRAVPAMPDFTALHGLGSKDRGEETMALCEGLIDVAAALFNVSSRELRRTGRTAQDVTRVRQIAMYVAHTSFRITQAEVGRCFVRDRTTVIHACQVVENLRDDAEFDRIAAITERVMLAAFGRRAEGREAGR